LWGKDLIEHFSDIYSNKARFCLMLISVHYPNKPWTRLERRSAQARALRQPEEYILPVRLDDTEVPGLLATIGYLDARRFSLEEIADQVVKKLGITIEKGKENPKVASMTGISKYNIPMPQVKKSYTQLDKDLFIENAFEIMKDYFRQALSELKHRNSETEANLKEINTTKFIARIYVQGQLKCLCKIWLGNSAGSQSILYDENPRTDINTDNSYNDYLSIDETISGLGLRISAFALGIGVKKPDQDVVPPEQAAEYFWRRFTSHM
jgi:hypothetical protein